MFTNASIGLRPALREEEEEDFATSSGGASGMISATSSAGASHIIGAIDATPSFAPDLQRILGIAAAIGRRVDPGDYEVSFSSLLFALLAVPDGMAGMVIAGPSGADLIRRSQKLNGVPWNEIESIALEAPPSRRCQSRGPGPPGRSSAPRMAMLRRPLWRNGIFSQPTFSTQRGMRTNSMVNTASIDRTRRRRSCVKWKSGGQRNFRSGTPCTSPCPGTTPRR
jgi:hypothetical protein